MALPTIAFTICSTLFLLYMKLIDVLASPLAALRGCFTCRFFLWRICIYRATFAFIVLFPITVLLFIVKSLTAFIVQFYKYAIKQSKLNYGPEGRVFESSPACHEETLWLQ